jgi:hypothetical protein
VILNAEIAIEILGDDDDDGGWIVCVYVIWTQN